MYFDLHVHSVFSSCSRLETRDILTHAKERGLSGVCITDHHSMSAAQEIREGVQKNGLCVIFGMEYSTSDGDFLIFGPFEEIDPGFSAPNLLRHVHAAGGAAVAAHPFRAARPVSEEVLRDGFCHIAERVNGRNSAWENHQAEEWFRRYSLIGCGGSDAHSLEELGKAGTFFSCPIRSRAELISALKQGKCRPAVPWAEVMHTRWDQQLRPLQTPSGAAGNCHSARMPFPPAMDHSNCGSGCNLRPGQALFG